MFFDCRAFTVAKDASDPSSNQDALEVDAEAGRAAVAVGFSCTLVAGPWGRAVVNGVGAGPPDVSRGDQFRGWLEIQRQAWANAVDVSELAWHQKTKLRDGASTTLLWVELTEADDRQFELRSFAIGDGCLFHVRGDQVLRAFPIEDSRLFDVNPEVLRSVAGTPDEQTEFVTLHDVCHPGDLLVLCTDAVAAWALVQLEAGGSPGWQSIWDYDARQWQQHILDLREAQQIRYDDSTVLMLRLTARVRGKESASAAWANKLKDSVWKKLPGGAGDD